jgi:hypothetical protein
MIPPEHAAALRAGAITAITTMATLLSIPADGEIPVPLRGRARRAPTHGAGLARVHAAPKRPPANAKTTNPGIPRRMICISPRRIPANIALPRDCPPWPQDRGGANKSPGSSAMSPAATPIPP